MTLRNEFANLRINGDEVEQLRWWLKVYEREVDILKDKVDGVLLEVPYTNDGFRV